MKTSQLFTIEVNKLGPNEALAELVYYFICRYGLSTVTRHMRQVDAATDAVISKTETTGD